MPRRPFVAGNWKMFMTVAESRHMVSELVPGLQAYVSVERVICPPFTALMAVKDLLEGTDIGLGAQNMHWEISGAFTGEVSPLMIAEMCSYIILGHSERRMYFGEDDQSVNRKVKAALAHGLIPIICVGETLEERDAGRTHAVVEKQVKAAFEGLQGHLGSEHASLVVVAYEPVWAIGTGRPSTVEGAAEVILKVIRPTLTKIFGKEFAEAVRVLYGGSINAQNAVEFFSHEQIDGGLVGGASLKPAEFQLIVQAASNSISSSK